MGNRRDAGPTQKPAGRRSYPENGGTPVLPRKRRDAGPTHEPAGRRFHRIHPHPSVSSVISGGQLYRTGNPVTPSPREV